VEKMDESVALQSTREPGYRKTVVSFLLTCGILSSLLYLATDVLAAMRWEGYRYVDRMASDLFAVGSPTRSFILLPMTVYNLLVIAFGVGVWLSAKDKRSLRLTGVLLVTYGFVSWMGLVVFPLRPDSQGFTAEGAPLSGVLHAILTFVLVVLMFLFIGFGSAALGKGFRAYSIATIAVVLAGGALAFAQVQRVAAGLPTPWLGLVERMNIYATLLWVAVFAVVLLRAQQGQEALPEATPTKPASARLLRG
jgi:Protein of unknown function (DUF998)